MTDPVPRLYRARLLTNDAVMAEETTAEGREVGTIKALVSAYNTEYKIGWRLWHTIKAGAFAEYEGKPIPLFWQHSWDWSEQVPIGTGTASETGAGLVVTGSIWLDTEAGRSVWRANNAGALSEWSIGYGVKTATKVETQDDEDHYDVTKGELLEASSVLRGANPGTGTLDTASENENDSASPETFDPELVERLMCRPEFRDLYRQD